MGLLSGHTSSPSNIILEDRQVLHYTYTICSSLFEHVVQVFNSVDKDELLAQHFERTHHLNLHVGTTNACTHGNRTFNKYFCCSYPHVPEAQLKNPYEIRRLIQSLNIQSAPGTDGISASKSLPQTSHQIHPTFQSYSEVSIFPLRPHSKAWETSFGPRFPQTH